MSIKRRRAKGLEKKKRIYIYIYILNGQIEKQRDQLKEFARTPVYKDDAHSKTFMATAVI